MPRVIYAWAGLPEMPDVAAHLQESLDWQPVLWVSYSYMADRLRALYPDVPWHDLEKAFVGVPVPGLNTPNPPTLDAAFMLRLQTYLPRLMNQMNRFGPPDCFLYDERESFARDLLMQWHEVLLVTEAEIVFFEEAPNSPYNYALYVLCLELGVSTVFLNATSIPGLSFVQEQVESRPLLIDEAFERELRHPSGMDLPYSVQETVERLTSAPEFQHDYMREQADYDKQFYAQASAAEASLRDTPRLRTRVLRALRVWRWIPLRIRNARERRRWRQQEEQRRQTPLLVARRKTPGQRIGSLDSTHGAYEDYLNRARAIKEGLREDYRCRCIEPDLDGERYVYFPLHYRPERTSNPDGGVFYDQFLPLAMVSEALPDGWCIYVKEHPTQFSMMMEGECGRTPQYYDEIAALRGVRFVSDDYSSKTLMLGAQACASITGTICFEAALNARPALYFGYPWYQGCPGTTRVTSAGDVARVLKKRESMIAKPGELDAYLRAIAQAAFPYWQTAWVLDPPPVTPAQQVSALCKALEWWHVERFSACSAPTQATERDIHR